MRRPQSRGTRRRPPEVRPTAFAARPPDLPPRPLMAVDFAIIGSLVRPGRPRYPVLVHRAATLLHAFFRPHLAMMPLRFANPSPPSGWIEDFHLQAVVQYSAHQQKARRDAGLFGNSADLSAEHAGCITTLVVASSPRAIRASFMDSSSDLRRGNSFFGSLVRRIGVALPRRIGFGLSPPGAGAQCLFNKISCSSVRRW